VILWNDWLPVRAETQPFFASTIKRPFSRNETGGFNTDAGHPAFLRLGKLNARGQTQLPFSIEDSTRVRIIDSEPPLDREQIFYGEFDGRKAKRVSAKVMGE